MVTGAVHAGIWWGDPRKNDHLEDLGVGRKMILKCVVNKWDGTGSG
jgi:hypothetical protein